MTPSTLFSTILATSVATASVATTLGASPVTAPVVTADDTAGAAQQRRRNGRRYGGVANPHFAHDQQVGVAFIHCLGFKHGFCQRLFHGQQQS